MKAPSLLRLVLVLPAVVIVIPAIIALELWVKTLNTLFASAWS